MGIANQANTLKEIKCSAGFSKKSYLLLENKTKFTNQNTYMHSTTIVGCQLG